MLGRLVHKFDEMALRISRDRMSALNQQMQANILQSYRAAFLQGQPPIERLTDAGFRCYSEYEEDGIILYLLAAVGFKTRTVVELCCGNGSECMAANLIINHGFKGYLFDGAKANVAKARSFYRKQKECRFMTPEICQAWITRDNINQLLANAGATGEIDLLSLDMDGNDYYIWEAIDVISPRVCVFETHNVIPGDLSLTIPYDETFFAWNKKGAEVDFRSVSLAAMQKLSTAKGYTMVGGHKHGFNVFFVRNDLMNSHLKSATINEVHDNEGTRMAQATRWEALKGMPWVEV
ncbi:hypothetical protein [Aurantiacibacter hainanensis]|uniref:hypothetical protein n=1 Tax=Aurantiacibacter hainanensis TaxID=3076114 RepID=UPI0030C67FFA